MGETTAAREAERRLPCRSCRFHQGQRLAGDPQQSRSREAGQYRSKIDECSLFSEICSPHGKCENLDGSYMCICDPGFAPTEDHKKCEGVYPI
ncbi:hypothetical protein AB205_0143690 [Aquarana catesbeiana]|uniref:EGF-like domain-containing protein n=1 Tax=Aquarana catesbeiana TaxID=8400 RepID=A0A2G9PV24_AQUCT|nr:hypothetical protein AB205_0143690 [Aquarana catesbeiana]